MGKGEATLVLLSCGAPIRRPDRRGGLTGMRMNCAKQADAGADEGIVGSTDNHP